MSKIVFHLLRTLAVLAAFAVCAAAAGVTWGSAAHDELGANAALDADADGDGDGDGDPDLDVDLDADVDADLDAMLASHSPSAALITADATALLVFRSCGLRPAGEHSSTSDRPPQA